ncbi:hypothetical protein MRB53_028849 [Persea americana]|uniref:Uncharacterized protein n=1 Tax=Persea americana TaxID=3435 RepID=A0ACC2KH81_PERAE|nr:hypothetical protein MRB53_028849 [Persea americana]
MSSKVIPPRKRTVTRRAPSTDLGKPSDGAPDSLRALLHTMVLQEHQMMEALQRMAPQQPEHVLRSTPQLRPAPQQSPFVLLQPLHSFSLDDTQLLDHNLPHLLLCSPLRLFRHRLLYSFSCSHLRLRSPSQLYGSIHSQEIRSCSNDYACLVRHPSISSNKDLITSSECDSAL